MSSTSTSTLNHSPSTIQSIVLPDESGFRIQSIHNAVGLNVSVLPGGALYAMSHGEIQINQVLGHPVHGAMASVYLRCHRQDAVTLVPIVGGHAQSRCRVVGQQIEWSGVCEHGKYVCVLELHPHETAWRWRVSINAAGGDSALYDLVLFQDVGLATRNALRLNEAYNSQYLDQRIEHHPQLGAVTIARQNRSQAGSFPSLSHAVPDGAAGAMTDGLDFFGTSFRVTDHPTALDQPTLATVRRQGEFAAAAIQTRPTPADASGNWDAQIQAWFSPTSEPAEGGSDLGTLPDKVMGWPATDQAATESGDESETESDLPSFERLRRVHGKEADPTELNDWFPGARRHEEQSDGKLWSFFYNDHHHVVLRGKLAGIDRSHGHVVRSSGGIMPRERDLCCTMWAGGVFASHLAVGNTSFQKFLGVVRNALDITGAGGLRIALATDDGWKTLGTPSAFEMSMEGCRWLYRLDASLIEVQTRYHAEKHTFDVTAEILEGEPCEMLVYAEVVMGVDEFDQPIKVGIDPSRGGLIFTHEGDSLFREHTPEAHFELSLEMPELIQAVGGAELITDGAPGGGSPVIAIRTHGTRKLQLSMTGHASSAQDLAAPEETTPAQIELGHQNETSVQRLDDCLAWFGHNANIHLSSPHGLDQYAGAAWGVRDVLQGSLEYLVALGHDNSARDILLRVFAQQDAETGEWPQWFMFDRYHAIRQSDCHGDIVVWPIKAVAHYIQRTADHGILDQKISYHGQADADTTVLDHLVKAIDRITDNFIPGTHLIRFGDGDWNDSLQPADESLREKMTSAWTVELVYQSLGELLNVLPESPSDHPGLRTRIPELRKQIRADFNRLLVRDETVGGFGIIENEQQPPELLLHPSDTRTGIHYRLLPMIRGVISGIFTPDQATKHMSTIEDHLLAPDGARLMNHPPRYRGGKETIFQRAESAATFSREIGLQYVHAHLRYAEALGCMGDGDAMFRALMQVNPIGLQDLVANACPRQANAYFSSSDADVLDRYEASQRYADLMKGDVRVKGGWRVYSSGPGIFIRLVVENLLGLSRYHGDLLIDPVMPASLHGLTCDLDLLGVPTRVEYVKADKPHELQVEANGKYLPIKQRLELPYRTGGIVIDADTLARLVPDQPRRLKIYF